METTDEDVCLLLERLLRTAAASSGEREFSTTYEVVSEYPNLIEEIQASLAAHPEFSLVGSLFFDSAQLHIHPYAGAISLAAYAVNQGSQAAIDWYRRMLATQSTVVRHMSLLSGLNVTDRIDFSNAISILPLERAGDSSQIAHARQLSSPHPLRGMSGFHLSAVAFRDVEHKRTNAVPKEPVDKKVIDAIEDVLVGCVLNEGLAPALVIHWKEFVDPELRALEMAWSAAGTPQEAPLSFGRPLTTKDIPNIELFLSKEGEFKEQLRVALARVGLARRKHTMANKAIEYSIALEALLGDGNAEMTHKIATRAAIILGKDHKQRVGYRKLFKNLYKARSLTVHGKKVTGENQQQTIRESEKAISELLLIAANRRVGFDFDKIDLSGEL